MKAIRRNIIIESSMIMNKVNIQPFNLSRNVGQGREVPLTPMVMPRNKKNISNVDKLRVAKREVVQNQQTLHFDDSFCFREKNRQVFTSEQGREVSTPRKKCCSQIFNVKTMDQFSRDRIRKESCFQLSPTGKITSGKNGEMAALVDLEDEKKVDKNNRRNYTSYSSRKKYQTIKASGIMTQRIKSSQINKSTLIPQSYTSPEIFPGIPPDHSQLQILHKMQSKNKYFWMANHNRTQLVKTSPVNPHKDRLGDNKKVNYYHIRPDQIKSLTLLQREQEKQLIEKRKKEQRALYFQMMQELKKKQELSKRNAKLKQEITINTKKKGKKVSNKRQINHHSTARNGRSEWKDEVRPWDVQQNATQPPFTDII